MDKGATEEITLVAKDGSTLTYNVLAGGDKTQAPTKIPQTGVKKYCNCSSCSNCNWWSSILCKIKKNVKIIKEK